MPSFGLASTGWTLILWSIWWRAWKMIGGPEYMRAEKRLKRGGFVQS